MREIRFRAWDKYNKKMWDPTEYGDSIKMHDEINHITTTWAFFIYISAGTGKVEAILQGGSFLVTDDPYPMYDCEKLKLEVLEYTGLKDVNGKGIYEDDVCDCVGGESAQGFHEFQEIGKVVFKDGCFGIENKENEFLPFFYLIEHGFEIFNCGSIYEDPELLEVSE